MENADFLTQYWGGILAAIGGLGTAAGGLVDATKALPGGGVSNSGFDSIQSAIRTLYGNATLERKGDSLLSRDLNTLHGNWINGRALADQQAIAKTLVKLRLDETTAKKFAEVTGVKDAASLTSAGKKMAAGQALSEDESNALGRFDLGLTALLDQAYQHADQTYRNHCKLLAGLFSLLLAVVGGLGLELSGPSLALCAVAGLLAVPLAPMTKDLTSALAAGVKVAQAIKR